MGDAHKKSCIDSQPGMNMTAKNFPKLCGLSHSEPLLPVEDAVLPRTASPTPPSQFHAENSPYGERILEGHFVSVVSHLKQREGNLSFG